jgi:hypothetical protein
MLWHVFLQRKVTPGRIQASMDVVKGKNFCCTA